MFDSIVFPTDGKRASERACEHALDLAEVHDADLHVVNVVERAAVEVVSAVEEDGRSEEEVEEDLEREGWRAVDDVADRARERGVTVDSAVIQGDPEVEIAGYAEDVDADVIVMGTEERADEYRDILGSVTERVLRRSSIPVLVVKT